MRKLVIHRPSLRGPGLRQLAVVLGAAMLSCRADPDYPKEPPIDLGTQAAPVPGDFSSEVDLAARYPASILPAFEAAESGSFAGVDGVPIHYHVFAAPSEKGAVVLLPGRAEPVLKYAELVADVVGQGYTVFAMDHRGQGESGRMTDDPQVGYVEYFDDYVADVDRFIGTIVGRTAHPKLFLVAHSMGGGIAVLYLDEHPDTFAAVALSSPLIEVDTGGFPESVAQTIASGDCSRSSGKSYAVGQEPFNPNLAFTDEDNDVTRSRARFDLKMDMFRAHPELQPGGVSYRWVCEALSATSYMQTLGKYSRVPTLLFQAGNEKVVGSAGEDRYCDEASRCQKVVYPDGYHENFMERDTIRNDALTKAMRFFAHFGN